jgi:hypothetical protein
MSDLLEQDAPGWRPDPSGRYEWRYWDGGWTNRVANSARTDPPDSPSPDVSSSGASSTGAPKADVPLGVPPIPEPELTPPPPDARVTDGAVTTAAFTARGASAPPLDLAPTNAPGESQVWTHPTRHDGSSGTVWDAPYSPDGGASDAPRAPKHWSGRIAAAVATFVRSFWEQEESYHSPNAGVDLAPHAKAHSLERPANYGRAGLVMLAACGVAVGAYLPWITYAFGGVSQEFTGYELGDATGFLLASAVFALAALLGARNRVMGWVTMGMSVVVAGLVARQLLDVHDQVMDFNRNASVQAEIGIGLWIMLVAAGIGLVAAFRLDTPAEIV